MSNEDPCRGPRRGVNRLFSLQYGGINIQVISAWRGLRKVSWCDVAAHVLRYRAHVVPNVSHFTLRDVSLPQAAVYLSREIIFYIHSVTNGTLKTEYNLKSFLQLGLGPKYPDICIILLQLM